MSSSQFMEPWKIKMVEPLHMSTREEREAWLKAVGLNVFQLRGDQVMIDCVTDSGTTAMSSAQWSALMLGDETYAGCDSFYKLEASVKDIMGFKYVVPTHQGRAAENLLANIFLKPGSGRYIIGNMHFDSMRVRAELAEKEAVDFLAEPGYHSTDEFDFKGNIDLEKVEAFIKEKGVDQIPVIMMTVTSNTNGGQPVSMANIKGLSEIARRYGIPFYIDAARYAENCYFIKQREPGYQDKTPKEIAREMFSYADGCTMSAKKDGMVNIGGFLCTNDDAVYAVASELVMCFEGFKTYGGMAGRDLEALAVGMQEGIDYGYLKTRVGQMEYFAQRLDEFGVPYVRPVGGNGVYLDGMKFNADIPQEKFPGLTLACELYLRSGIRCAELGTSAFSKTDADGKLIMPRLDLVRVAISRRVWTNSHIDYIAEQIGALYQEGSQYGGVRKKSHGLVAAQEHFTSGYEFIQK